MSYCVALKLSRGLLFMSDTLTNGGVDDISSYPKTFSWGVPGERQILLSAAGNLATSQAAVNTLSENIKNKKIHIFHLLLKYNQIKHSKILMIQNLHGIQKKKYLPMGLKIYNYLKINVPPG